MKTSIVPAQITTVEDRIAGNLSLSQILLFTLPVFLGAALYIILPPNLHSAPYKVLVTAMLTLVSALLGVRVRGKIILLWLVVVLRYNLRPQHYVFNKNSMIGRETEKLDLSLLTDTEEANSVEQPVHQPALSVAEIARVQSFIENPAANLTFKTNRKGGLRVLITEVKEQS